MFHTLKTAISWLEALSQLLVKPLGGCPLVLPIGKDIKERDPWSQGFVWLNM